MQFDVATKQAVADLMSEPDVATDSDDVRLATALAYARRGWFLLPVGADKRPLGGVGLASATTDEAVIRGWFERWPNCGVALACKPSGVVVIDCDRGHADGADGVAAFDAMAGPEPHGAALIARTPAGGEHRLYATPAGVEFRSKNHVAPGIDVKAGGGDHGGYVVLPSGDGEDGREWIEGDPLEDEIDEPPAWLVAWLTVNVGVVDEQREQVAASHGPGKVAPAGTVDDHTFERVRSALHSIPATAGRDDWLTAIYGVKDALRADERGAGLVERWSEQAELYDRRTKTGQYRPGEASRIYRGARLPEEASGVELVSEASLYDLAQEHGWEDDGDAMGGVTIDIKPKPAASTPAQAEPATAAATPTTVVRESVADILSQKVGKVSSLTTAPARVPYLVRLSTRKGAAVPPGGEGDGFLRRGIACSLVAAGGAGKTMAALDLAASIALGKPWLGLLPTSGPGHSFVILAEEDHDEAHRRLWHLAEARGWNDQQRAEVRERVTVAGLRGIPNCGLLEIKKFKLQVAEFARRLKCLLHESAPKEGWSLIALDPLSRLAGVELDLSNTNATAIVQVAEWLGEVPGNPTVLLGIHASKASRQKGQQVQVRGPSGLTDGVRLEMTLRREGGAVHLCAEKNNYGPRLADKGLKLEVGDHGVFERAVDSPLAEDAEAAAEARRVADEGADYEQRVIAKLREVGSAVSKTSLCDVVSGKRGKVMAAWDRLIGDGRIANLGTSREKRFEVVAPAADGVCAQSPPHPPVPGNRELGLEGPSPVPFPGGEGNLGEPSGNRELDGPDDGRPEQPNARRRRKGAGR